MVTSLKNRLAIVVLCLLAASAAFGQNAAPELNITLGEQRVRFAPTRSFQEMRLEVVNSVGEVVFLTTTAEAEFAWNLRAGNDEALAPGLYRYRLTLKYSAEQATTHRGHFIVEQNGEQIWLTTNEGAEVTGSVSGAQVTAARDGREFTAGVRESTGTVRRDSSGREVVDETGKPLADTKNSQGGKNIVSASLADQVVDGNLVFTPNTAPGAFGLRDILMQSNAGGLRFYGAPSLGAIPDAAAIQFWGNASPFAGNLFLDSGATNSASLIFRTASAGNAVTERMRVANNGNVGIGDTTPTHKLDVAGNINTTTQYNIGGNRILSNAGSANLFAGVGAGNANTTGQANAFFGFNAGFLNTSGNSNAFFGRSAGDTNVDGGNNTAIGATADVGSGNLTFATAVGSAAIVTQSSHVQLGRDSFDTVSIGALIGGGTTAVCLNGRTFASCSSSQRYKQNVQPLRGGLNLIRQLRPVTFDWKERLEPDLGLIAEDVAKVEPLLVTHNQNGVIEGVKYDQLNVVLINAIKEQQAQIQQLMRANQRLQRRLNQVERKVKTRRR